MYLPMMVIIGDVVMTGKGEESDKRDGTKKKRRRNEEERRSQGRGYETLGAGNTSIIYELYIDSRKYAVN